MQEQGGFGGEVLSGRVPFRDALSVESIADKGFRKIIDLTDVSEPEPKVIVFRMAEAFTVCTDLQDSGFSHHNGRVCQGASAE